MAHSFKSTTTRQAVHPISQDYFDGSTSTDSNQLQFSPPNQSQFDQTNPDVTCYFCGGDHLSRECNKYPDARSRLTRAYDINLCTTCLRSDHQFLTCPHKQNICKHCSGNHHELLCFKSADLATDTSQSPVVHKICVDEPIALQGFRGLIRNPKTNVEKEITIFIDSGATTNFISDELAKSLDLPRIRPPTKFIIRSFNRNAFFYCSTVDFQLVDLRQEPVSFTALTNPQIIKAPLAIPTINNPKLSIRKYKVDLLLSLVEYEKINASYPVPHQGSLSMIMTNFGIVYATMTNPLKKDNNTAAFSVEARQAPKTDRLNYSSFFKHYPLVSGYNDSAKPNTSTRSKSESMDICESTQPVGSLSEDSTPSVQGNLRSRTQAPKASGPEHRYRSRSVDYEPTILYINSSTLIPDYPIVRSQTLPVIHLNSEQDTIEVHPGSIF